MSNRNFLYTAIWRWHFLAGLIALPFLIGLSVTGVLYLFKDEINDTLFAARNIVAEASATLPPSALVRIAEQAVPGSTALSLTNAASATHSATVTVQNDDSKTIVWLNPSTGAVLGAVAREQEFNTVVKHLHSLAYFGDDANRLIEIVAGFTLVLVVTGFYLWWPRGKNGGVMSVRGTPRSRVFWRDAHAVTGALSGALIFFLALSGMPWSSFWGERVHQIADAQGWGYPKGMWDNVPNSGAHADHVVDKSGWTLATSPVSVSSAATGFKPIGIDRAFDIARAQGVAPGFQLSLPRDADGVYTASIFPDDLQRQRLVHIDQYSGSVLIDAGFKDYGAAAKAIEFGINTHMGQEFGTANQIVMLLTCVAIIFSSVTAIVMWWKRRPAGRLGMPARPQNTSVYRFLGCAMLGFGLAFPLSGLAIVVMIASDMLVIRHVPALRRMLS